MSRSVAIMKGLLIFYAATRCSGLDLRGGGEAGGPLRMPAQPALHKTLRFGHLHRGHARTQHPDAILAGLIATKLSQRRPHVRLHIILPDTAPRPITRAQGGLRRDVSLLCRAHKPFRRLAVVL